MNCCHACVAAGVTLRLHRVALEAFEAAHPQQSDARPALAAVVPLKPDDDHRREFESVVRIVDVNFADVGSAAALSDDGANFTLDMLRRIARQNFQERWRRPLSGLLFSSSNE